VVSVAEGEALFASAAEPKRFTRYPTGGHLFADREAADHMTADVAAWFTETL